jgi:hypothetical protein
MEWINIYHECLIDKDYSIINIMENYECPNIYYLNNVKSFVYDLHNSYNNLNEVMRQIKVDYPRIICYVNNIKIPTYLELIKELKHTNLIYKATLICTQSVFYPIISLLFKEYTNIETDTHFSDYSKDNPVIVNLKIFGKNNMSANVEKNFRIIRLVNGDPCVLSTKKLSIFIEIGIDKLVSYSVEDVPDSID